MWKIWANYFLSKALKSCPKSNKSPNLVTLDKALYTHVCNFTIKRFLDLEIFFKLDHLYNILELVEPVRVKIFCVNACYAVFRLSDWLKF